MDFKWRRKKRLLGLKTIKTRRRCFKRRKENFRENGEIENRNCVIFWHRNQAF